MNRNDNFHFAPLLLTFISNSTGNVYEQQYHICVIEILDKKCVSLFYKTYTSNILKTV